MMMSNLTGITLGNRYRFEALIGEGTFARVYRVYDLKRGVDLAAKVLRSDVAHEATFIERFRREAQVLARLQHPHIVRFYDVVEMDNHVFILMDFIDGTTLHSHLYHLNRPLNVRETLQFLKPMSTALTFAHGENIIHRDIKPGNILLSKTGQVYVTDFGIARLLDDAGSLTQGMSIGTPLYMAPEQILAQPITIATDVYAMGVLLYRMLTGEVPFSGKSPQATGETAAERVAYEHVNLPPTRPSQMNPALSQAVDEVLLAAMRKDPKTRYPSVVALHDALAETVGATPAGIDPVEMSAGTVSPPTRPPEWSQAMGKVEDQYRTLDPGQPTNPQQPSVPVAPPAPPAAGTAATLPGIPQPQHPASQPTLQGQPPAIPAPAYPPTRPNTPPARSTQPHMQAVPPQAPPYSPYDPQSPYNTQNLQPEYETSSSVLDTSQPWFWVVAGLGALFVIGICIGALVLGLSIFSNGNEDENPTARPGTSVAGGVGVNTDRVFIYAGLSGGNLDIFRANIDGTGVTRLTTATTNESVPKYSPDGLQIAYHAYQGTNGAADIWLMSATGGNPRRLTTSNADERNVTWSPDGTKIAYESNETGKYNIYIYDLTTNQATNLTKSNFNDRAPAWSPDGGRIAFHSDQNGGNEIFLIKTDGTGRIDVTEGQWQEAVYPDWVFDAGRLVFHAGTPGDYQLYAINPDAGGFQNLIAQENNYRNASWATQGVRLLYVGGTDSAPEVFLTDFTTGRTTRVIGNAFFPDWSP